MKTPFKMKGWSPFTRKEGRKTTRGTGKTYEQRWKELSEKQKAKHLGDIELFKAAGELYHSKKDIEYEKEYQKVKTAEIKK